MKVTIFDEQTSCPINEKAITSQVRAILSFEKINSDEVIIHYVNDAEIIKLHKKYFNDASSTDCISFPIGLKNKNEYHILGEVFICTDVALRYSEDNKIPLEEELTLYLIHNLLHLIGYDDIDKEDEIIMRKKEKELMELLKQKKLLGYS